MRWRRRRNENITINITRRRWRRRNDEWKGRWRMRNDKWKEDKMEEEEERRLQQDGGGGGETTITINITGGETPIR
jgi:hypothetical protein